MRYETDLATATATTSSVTSPSTTAAGAASSGGGSGPVFIAGADRSGTTLLFALLASHPNLSMVRRTNMWRYFHRRYGDLGDASNLDRCLDDMLRYRRMQHLDPDRERIRAEFERGEPTYGRLFALFHEHHALAAGKQRWGDKSLHTERYASRVFDEYPDARIVHMIRDPRDRYASVRKRHGRDVPRVGAATGRWLLSTRFARRNARRFAGRYRILRYEDLATAPEARIREVCEFLGEPFVREMLAMNGASDHTETGGNSSFGDVDPRTISTSAIGRYRTVLSPLEIRFIELVAGRAMRSLGYRRERPRLSARERVRFIGRVLPEQLLRMAIEVGRTRIELKRGVPRPASRFAEAPLDDDEGAYR
jgi:hypothetical protein